MSRKDKNAETTPEELAASAAEGQAASAAAVTLSPEEELKLQLEQLSEEKQKYYDLYLRALAEAENVRKRTAREREEYVRYGTESLLKRLLGVMDDLERAVSEAGRSQDLAALSRGVELTAKNLEEILKSEGLETVPAEGLAFDPQRHQALLVEPRADMEENMVIEVLQKGYLLRDRLIRPALVRVSG